MLIKNRSKLKEKKILKIIRQSSKFASHCRTTAHRYERRNRL